ncbi:hypothetical protein [Xenorhabdus hominickii]|uniref:Uncharacterized protein n=1 Tax=Xenorhabdus hominickii TaxID=351679 RepID=A0A1V0M4N6_XENHO|nr:hypothetical protein [Xenorhabdus hominickii]ARD69844.1 hypothetical protein [Xenorhabdus hominickii]PHM51880.1 hypothetical protein Xhom_04719 [Xenorhabdus hominickii]
MIHNQSTSEKRYYTKSELEDLAGKRGYLLNFNRLLKVFELKDKQHDSRWCWIVRPSNGNKIERVRECEMSEWDTLLAFNIARLEKSTKFTPS